MQNSELATAARRQNIRYATAQVEENRRQRRLSWQAEARLLWEQWHSDPLFLLGIGLYWGEGHKSSRCPRLRLCNADVHLLRIWLAWCQRFLPGVPLVFAVNLHANCDADAARRFWEEHLSIKVTSRWVAVSAASRHPLCACSCDAGLTCAHSLETRPHFLSAAPVGGRDQGGESKYVVAERVPEQAHGSPQAQAKCPLRE